MSELSHNTGFSFSALDLSNVEIGGSRIRERGAYVLEIKDAKLEPTNARDGSMKLTIQTEATNGKGGFTFNLNVLNKKSAEAQRIGREQLKKVLYYGGHPNPDKPTDVALMRGLKFGAVLDESEYTSQRTGEVKKGLDLKAIIDPADIEPEVYTRKAAPAQRVATPTVTAGSIEDEIPF